MEKKSLLSIGLKAIAIFEIIIGLSALFILSKIFFVEGALEDIIKYSYGFLNGIFFIFLYKYYYILVPSICATFFLPLGIKVLKRHPLAISLHIALSPMIAIFLMGYLYGSLVYIKFPDQAFFDSTLFIIIIVGLIIFSIVFTVVANMVMKGYGVTIKGERKSGLYS